MKNITLKNLVGVLLLIAFVLWQAAGLASDIYSKYGFDVVWLFPLAIAGILAVIWLFNWLLD